MRPERIKMEAFGSYLKPTVCDFMGLYASRLFLITGPTGGGKTTILDAMSFALYGKSTGGKREFRDMRALAADDATDTVVEFVFRLGAERYRFMRRLHIHKKRTGGIEEQITAECQIDTADGWKSIFGDKLGSPKSVDQKALELLKFTHEQFSQVIVLPQGEFRKLLLAKSDEKRKILQVLFGTGVWDRCVAVISNRLIRLDKELSGLHDAEKTLLKSNDCENFEVLQTLCAQTGEQLCEAEKQSELAAARYNQAAGALTAARETAADFDALEQALARAKQLDDARGAYAESCKTLGQAQHARVVLPTYQRWKDAERTAAQKRLESDAATAKSAQCKAALDAANSAMTTVPENEEKLKQLQEEIARIKRDLQDAKDLATHERAYKQAEKTAADKKAELEKASGELDRLTARIEKGEGVVKAARDAHLQALSDNAAALLAGNLRDGAPCPVCGSVHHPAPTHTAETSDADALAKKAAEVERLLDDLKQQRETKKTALEAARTAYQAADGAYQVALARFSDAKARLGDAGSYDALLKLKNERETAETALRTQLDATKKAAQDAQVQFAAATTAGQAAQTAFAETQKARDAARTQFGLAAQKAGFAPDTDFEQTALTDEQMSELEQSIEQYKRDTADTSAKIEFLQARLADKTRPDLEKLGAEKQSAESDANAARQSVGSLTQRRKQLQNTISEIEKMRADSRELDEEWSRVKRVKDLIDGANVNKTPLINFVQSLMLDDVVAAATRFLRKLSRGRFALIRTDYSGKGGGHKGLDIGVVDANTGGRRKAETLSGGEQFLASLSLAFGLAEVVQSEAGGVILDSIFIDEGFGTLDHETLDAAMRALDDIRGDGRLVGIISHVSELKNRIPARVEVTAGDDGSHLAIKGI